MTWEWKADNTLERAALQATMRTGGGIQCARVGCDNRAVDVHHLDGDHRNDEPSNLAGACKVCHNDVHDITAEISDLKLLTRLFYEAQEQRIAAALRVRAYENLGIPVPFAKRALEDAKEYEQHLHRRVRALLKVNPVYNAWLKHIKGIGPRLGASVISEVGSPTKFRTVSALWSYSGLDVREGAARRRRKGEHANWNPRLKTTAWKIASQFVKTPNCFGRQLYDQYKQFYAERDGSEPRWQPHRRALRRVAKDFLRCLWVAWMQSMELPVTGPREGTWPMPEDWIEGIG